MKHLLPLCLLLAAVITAKANGDPVAVHSALTLSPTPVAVHVPEVQLVDEAVSFVPRDRYMEVTVRYLLHNRSNRNFDKLPYGFPIDYIGTGKARWEPLDDFTESQREVGWRDDYIRNVSFLLNDVQLLWQYSHDSIIVPATPYISGAFFDTISVEGRREFDSLFAIYGDSLYSYTDPISRRWYYTYLNIPAKSFVVLEVRYTVECTLDGRAIPLSNNFTNHIYSLSFQYDFTPAAYWGNGHANHFYVTLDTTGIILERGLQTFAKETFILENGFVGLPLQPSRKVWQYEARDLDLAATKPFRVIYSLTDAPHQPLERILNHRVDPSEYTITVSGTDKEYPIANLSDLNPASTTILRPNKADSLYITIRFKKPTMLDGLLLFNGNTKNQETYQDNSRIDSLLVFGDLFDVYNFDANNDTTISNNFVLIDFSYWQPQWEDVVPTPEKCPEREIKSFNWQSLVDNALKLNLSYGPDYMTYYTEIRIHITATTKGLKYNDLCVSELLLIGK